MQKNGLRGSAPRVLWFYDTGKIIVCSHGVMKNGPGSGTTDKPRGTRPQSWVLAPGALEIRKRLPWCSRWTVRFKLYVESVCA